MLKNVSTKPKGATSYKETTLGIIPRNRLLKDERDFTKLEKIIASALNESLGEVIRR